MGRSFGCLFPCQVGSALPLLLCCFTCVSLSDSPRSTSLILPVLSLRSLIDMTIGGAGGAGRLHERMEWNRSMRWGKARNGANVSTRNAATNETTTEIDRAGALRKVRVMVVWRCCVLCLLCGYLFVYCVVSGVWIGLVCDSIRFDSLRLGCLRQFLWWCAFDSLQVQASDAHTLKEEAKRQQQQQQHKNR